MSNSIECILIISEIMPALTCSVVGTHCCSVTVLHTLSVSVLQTWSVTVEHCVSWTVGPLTNDVTFAFTTIFWV